MLKLGYSLITKTEALWIQIFRAKYCLVKCMPDSIMRNRCSYMWKAVAKVWPLLRSNMIWSIRNRRLWLPEEVAKQIISISPPLDSARPDILSWSRSTTGVFSVKNAYYMLKEEYWNPKDTSVYQKSSICVYLNTDSVVHSVSGLSAAGGVIRDGKRKWILGPILLGPNFGALHLTFEEKWSLIYILRETNRAADALAKMALLSDKTLHMFEDPPLEIKEILKDDSTLIICL
ncbi:hypothetical protein Gotur_012852 [Gossypium turneri]